MNLQRNGSQPSSAGLPSTSTHLAIQEALDGRVVDWMEPVTDEQYGAAREES
jgi:hypothetical protein